MLEDFPERGFKYPHDAEKEPPLGPYGVGGTYMAEAAPVLAVRSSARMLAVLRLRFRVALLKPAQNEVPEEPRQRQNAERPESYSPHHSPRRRSSAERGKTSRTAVGWALRCGAGRARRYGSRLAEVSFRRLTLAVRSRPDPEPEQPSV